MPKIPSNTFLTGFKANAEKTCFAKDICTRLQDKYSRELYPVCTLVQKVIGKEKPSIAKVPKTNHHLLDSIIKILVVFESLIQLKPNKETVGLCVHSENFLEKQLKPIKNDLSALSQRLEKDYPDTSKKCIELVAELELAEFTYTMNSNSLVYFLPDDLEYGNWATFIEWRKREIQQVKHNGFSDEIEMYRLTCHYPAEAIKAAKKIYSKLCPLVDILSEKANEKKTGEIEKPSYSRTKTVSELIDQGENHNLEFKETFQYNIKTKIIDKNVRHDAIKTIAGFMNADGGTLLIGVSDRGEVKGIARDTKAMNRADNDKFELNIRNNISGENSKFNPHAVGHVKFEFEKLQDHTICIIDVQPFPKSKILHFEKIVYVRDGNQTLELTGKELADWIKQRQIDCK